LKKKFEGYLSPQISSKSPSPQRDGAEKKKRENVLKKREREKERKRKAPRVSSNKRGSQHFERRKTLQLQNPFCISPFSSPPSYHFKNPFQNHLRKFCSSFWTIV
jgi:hypothetical protein